MADHSKPSLTDLYTNWPVFLRDRSDDAVKWLDGITATNLPTNAKRWNGTTFQIENWNGTAWASLPSLTITGTASDGSQGITAKSGKPTFKLIDTTASARSYRWAVDGNNLLLEPDNANAGGSWGASVVSIDNTGKITTTDIVLSGSASTATTAPVDTNSTRLATTAFVVGQAGTALPLMNGVADDGVSLRYSKQDHKHPSDTTKANLASPAFTGTPTAPTATAGTNTTQIATTAFVQSAVDSVVVPVTSVAGKTGAVTLTANDIGSGKFPARVTSATNSNVTIANSTVNSSKFAVEGSATGAAYMEFHRLGVHAVSFGLDTDNVLKIGGQTLGASSYTIWHSGNLNPANYVTSGSTPSFAGLTTTGTLVMGSSNTLHWPTYGGGWNMVDITYIRSYNNKAIYTGGDILAGGNVTAYSDARLKDDVKTFNNALEICSQIEGVRFVWNDHVVNQNTKRVGTKDFGVIAQEVQKVLPEIVIETQDIHDECGTILTVDYSKLTPVLLQAIKELKQELDTMKEELKTLKGG